MSDASDAVTPSAERSELHEIDDVAACALVDETLGVGEEWRSLIIRYRFTSDFQAHWKAEVGHWIHTARRHGFEDRLVARARARANHQRPRLPEAVTVDDRLYVVLLQELGPAMVAHYFLRTGWGYRCWDVPDQAGGDVDLGIVAPSGELVDIQIKVPGIENPIASVENAVEQLRTSPNRKLVVVCSRDERFPSCNPDEFLTESVGRTTTYEDGTTRLTAQGRFARGAWRQLGGITLLDYIPGASRQNYCCTMLMNPWPLEPELSPSWFDRARVLQREGERFRWQRGEPDVGTVPEGTYIPADLRQPLP